MGNGLFSAWRRSQHSHQPRVRLTRGRDHPDVDFHRRPVPQDFWPPGVWRAIMKRFLMTITGVLLLIFALPVFASAHANLDHAEPKVGATVSQSPKEVKIWFSQSVEPAFSTIEVFDSGGKQIDKKDSHVDKADKELLIVSVPAL